MDPLSISVSVITVLAAADRLISLFPTAQRFFDAPKEIQDFQTELQHLRMVLVAVAESSANTRHAALEGVLGDCLETLESLNNEMVVFTTQEPKAAGKSGKLFARSKRIAWIIVKPRIIQSRQRLRDALALITVALVTQNTRVPRMLEADRWEVSIVQGDDSKMPCMESAGSSVQLPSPKDAAELGPNGQCYRVPPPREGCGEEFSASHDSSTATAPSTGLYVIDNPLTDGKMAEKPAGSLYDHLPPVKSPAQRPPVSCLGGCMCSCHVRTTSGFELLGGLLGKGWIVNTGGTCDKGPCAEPLCVGSRSVCHILWYGPRWLSDRGVSLSITNTGRIQTTLSFPRILPPDHQLFAAIRQGDTHNVQYLLATGQASIADIAAPYGHTPLDLAVLCRQPDVCQILMERGAQQLVPPSWAVSDVLDFFMQWSAIESTMDAGTVIRDLARIYDRCRDGDGKMTKIEAQIAKSSFSALHNSVLELSSQSVADAAKASRAAGTVNEPDSFGRTALHWAAKTGHDDAVHILLQCGADPNLRDRDGMMPLHVAASRGQAACAAHLIQGGADLGAGERFGASPLHVAATSGSLAVITALLDAGADVDQVNTLGETPAIHANWAGGQHDALRLLVRRGAHLDHPDAWGYTELSDAVQTNSHETLPFLLRASRKSHCKLVDGRTILHVAARNADVRTIRILLDAHGLLDVDPQAVDDAGATALDYLQLRKDAERVLEPFGSLLLQIEADRASANN